MLLPFDVRIALGRQDYEAFVLFDALRRAHYNLQVIQSAQRYDAAPASSQSHVGRETLTASGLNLAQSGLFLEVLGQMTLNLER